MSEDPLEFWKGQDRFLLKIAKKVDQIIHENPSNLARFRQQVGVFVKKCESFLANIESNKENAPYILAPVLPEDYRAQLPSPQSKQDLLPDYYFILQLIHDKLLSPPEFVSINNGLYQKDDQWVGCCWSHYGRLMGGNKTKALIETALEYVKDDLAKLKPAETTVLMKCWGIIKRILGWIFKKTSHFILTVIGAVIVTIVVDVFADFGWLQSIKAFIYSILWPK